MNEWLIKEIFGLTYANMTQIISSDTSEEENYLLWRKSFDDGLANGVSHIIELQGKTLCGYLSYRDCGDHFYLNELQIAPAFQKKGVVLRRLIVQFLINARLVSAKHVVTYSNRLNVVSNSLIRKVGFHLVEETERGYRYQCDIGYLLARFDMLRAHQDLQP